MCIRLQELAERDKIEAENKVTFARKDAACARVEGRTRARGQHVWMDIEIEGQKYGDQKSDPTQCVSIGQAMLSSSAFLK